MSGAQFRASLSFFKKGHKNMKKLMFGFLALLVPIGVFATITSSQEYRLNRMNEVAQSTQLGTLLAKTPNIVVGKYSFAVQGGATSSSVYLLRDLTQGTGVSNRVKIPANAVVKQVYIDALTTTTGGSVAVCLNTCGTPDLKTAVTAFTAGTITAGTPVNSAATMIKQGTSDKYPWVAITNTALTAGKFNVYIEYVLGD
jgi:hypothetical protein